MFFTGILFLTNVSLTSVPHLQKVVQADACHMHFGEYTLFSAYGSTANGSMAPVAFGVLFGNEKKGSWGKFWKFVSLHYPSLNNPLITIITDQDKGSIAAIKEYMPNTHHFHCSWHHANNVMLACKKGRKLYSGYWNFKQLVGCLTTDEIQRTNDKYQDKVSDTVLTYVNRLADTAQYLAVRCRMGEDIVMYRCTASSRNKSMNPANNCQHIAINLVNITMVILKLKSG